MASIKGKLNFNTKHLKTGDPLPTFNGKLRVYNMRFCPYAQRTILAVLAKQIDCEVINIDLAEKPEWLTSKSPFGKVPALEIADGKTICESLVTVEYLDQVYPQRPLLPKDPYMQAIDKVIVQAIGPVPRDICTKTASLVGHVRDIALADSDRGHLVRRVNTRNGSLENVLKTEYMASNTADSIYDHIVEDLVDWMDRFMFLESVLHLFVDLAYDVKARIAAPWAKWPEMTGVICDSTMPVKLKMQIESLYIKLIKFPDKITEDNYTAYYKALEFIEGELKNRSTKFIDGSEPGYADYMIWPFFERLRIFNNESKMRIDEKNYPLLAGYIKNMLNDPVVNEYLIPLDILIEYQSAYVKGTKPKFDILIEN